jgi:hypothetical protein
LEGEVGLEVKVEQTAFNLLAKEIHTHITYVYGKTLVSTVSYTLYVIYYLRIQNKNLQLIIVNNIGLIYNVNPVVVVTYEKSFQLSETGRHNNVCRFEYTRRSVRSYPKYQKVYGGGFALRTE